jgi:hypothetical protein
MRAAFSLAITSANVLLLAAIGAKLTFSIASAEEY